MSAADDAEDDREVGAAIGPRAVRREHAADALQDAVSIRHTANLPSTYHHRRQGAEEGLQRTDKLSTVCHRQRGIRKDPSWRLDTNHREPCNGSGDFRHGDVRRVGAVGAYELELGHASRDAIVQGLGGGLEASNTNLPCSLSKEAQRVSEPRLTRLRKTLNLVVDVTTQMGLIEGPRLLLLCNEQHVQLEPVVNRRRKRSLLLTASSFEPCSVGKQRRLEQSLLVERGRL